MFASFFKSREWALWAWLGASLIIGATWYQVQLDVKINDKLVKATIVEKPFYDPQKKIAST